MHPAWIPVSARSAGHSHNQEKSTCRHSGIRPAVQLLIVGRLCLKSSQQTLGALHTCVLTAQALEEVSLFSKELIPDSCAGTCSIPDLSLPSSGFCWKCRARCPSLPLAGGRSCPARVCPCCALSPRPLQRELQLPGRCPAEPGGSCASAGDRCVFSSPVPADTAFIPCYRRLRRESRFGIFLFKESNSGQFLSRMCDLTPATKLAHQPPLTGGMGERIVSEKALGLR